MLIIDKSLYEIRYGKKKGRGVFAKKDIAPGKIIADYIGTITNPKKTKDPDDIYEIYRSDAESIYPDKNSVGAHLLNHSCSPNCHFYPYQGRSLIVSVRKIFKGEELTHTYLLSLPNPGRKVFAELCQCGSRICRGSFYAPESYLDDYWALEERLHGKFLKIRLGKYGSVITPLKKYPEFIPDNQILNVTGSDVKRPLICPEKVLPGIAVLKRKIRESGRQLSFPNLKLTVKGIIFGKIVCFPL